MTSAEAKDYGLNDEVLARNNPRKHEKKTTSRCEGRRLHT
jgi:hypothetical protein